MCREELAGKSNLVDEQEEMSQVDCIGQEIFVAAKATVGGGHLIIVIGSIDVLATPMANQTEHRQSHHCVIELPA